MDKQLFLLRLREVGEEMHKCYKCGKLATGTIKGTKYNDIPREKLKPVCSHHYAIYYGHK